MFHFSDQGVISPVEDAITDTFPWVRRIEGQNDVGAKIVTAKVNESPSRCEIMHWQSPCGACRSIRWKIRPAQALQSGCTASCCCHLEVSSCVCCLAGFVSTLFR